MSPDTRLYRLALGVALGALLLVLYGIAALGVIGPGGPPDLLYVGALAVGVAGALLARFRAGGMAKALAATAAAVVLAGVVAITLGYHDTEGASVLEILGLSGMFAGLFAVSAWLFQRAAGHPSVAAPRGRR